MLTSGFTIVRNGVKFDFPFLESIRSALPLCDEFIVNLGVSEDETRARLQGLLASLPPNEARKIRIIENDWPLNQADKRQGGQILSDQTNIALEQCRGIWCLYLQADEVLHEADYGRLRDQLARWKDDSRVEGLVLNYVHFYGNYHMIQTSRSSYRREIRVIRNGIGIRSMGDAQSFRHRDGRKIAVALSGARVFHYGWVRPQEVMREKTAFLDTLYHPAAQSDGSLPATGTNYQYKRIVGLKTFKGTHPAVMQERVRRAPHFDFSKAPKVFHIEDTWKLVSGWIEYATGIRLFEYRNYRQVKQ